MQSVEDHLCRLKSSKGASTSATSVCSNLASLKDLHDGINNLIQMPSFQQALSNEQGQCWLNEMLEGSIRLVDLCAFSRDIVCSTKESIHDLESSIRRSKAETATSVDVNAYVASRKNISKMVKKYLKKNLKSFNQNSTSLPDRDNDLKTIGTFLKETESLGLSVLKSVLTLLSGEKERSNGRRRSLFAKFTQTSRVYSEVELESCDEDLRFMIIHKSRKSLDSMGVKNALKQSETSIQEVEEGLESLFRSLVKTRVSLLNVLSQ